MSAKSGKPQGIEIVQACCCIGMLPAKDLLANRQSLFEQRFGFGMVAHRLIEQRQIVQNREAPPIWRTRKLKVK